MQPVMTKNLHQQNRRQHSRFHLLLISTITFVALVTASLATFNSARAANFANAAPLAFEVQQPVSPIPADSFIWSGRKAAGYSGYVSEVGPTPLPDNLVPYQFTQLEWKSHSFAKRAFAKLTLVQTASFEKIPAKKAILAALIILLASMITVTFGMWHRTANNWKTEKRNTRVRA